MHQGHLGKLLQKSGDLLIYPGERLKNAGWDEKPFIFCSYPGCQLFARRQEAVHKKMLRCLALSPPAPSHVGWAGVAHGAGLPQLPLLPRPRKPVHKLTAHTAQLGAPYVCVGAYQHWEAGMEIEVSAFSGVPRTCPRGSLQMAMLGSISLRISASQWQTLPCQQVGRKNRIY